MVLKYTDLIHFIIYLSFMSTIHTLMFIFTLLRTADDPTASVQSPSPAVQSSVKAEQTISPSPAPSSTAQPAANNKGHIRMP